MELYTEMMTPGVTARKPSCISHTQSWICHGDIGIIGASASAKAFENSLPERQFEELPPSAQLTLVEPISRNIKLGTSS